MAPLRKRVGEAARADDYGRKRMKREAVDLMGLEHRVTIVLTLDDEPAREPKTFIDLTGDCDSGSHKTLTHRVRGKGKKTNLSVTFAHRPDGKQVREIATICHSVRWTNFYLDIEIVLRIPYYLKPELSSLGLLKKTRPPHTLRSLGMPRTQWMKMDGGVKILIL